MAHFTEFGQGGCGVLWKRSEVLIVMGRNDERGLALVRGNKYPMLLGNRLDCLRVVNGFRAGLGDDRFGIAQRGACDLNG